MKTTAQDCYPSIMVILFLTVVVAFCSIIYELVFSQVLTIVFGETVTRYSITIGLYMFSLGWGALLFSRVKQNNYQSIFFRVEVLLSILGPLSVLTILLLNNVTSDLFLSASGRQLLLVCSHLPILLIGFLSGMEIPLLVSLLSGKENKFYNVLGLDYFGSLIGTLAFSLWLYPKTGIIPTVIITGFFNFLAAFLFLYFYWPQKKILICLNFFFLLSYAVLAYFSSSIARPITELYLANRIKLQYWATGGPVDEVKIVKQFTTPYQQVTEYKIKWDPECNNINPVETCLNLDDHIQLCDSWVKDYHHGLIDIPLGFFPAQGQTDLLLIGGGDFIPHNFLRKYPNIKVDHVDIDREFMDFAKQDPFLRKYNQFKKLDDRFNTIVGDGFAFLKSNSKKYDLIILDLPGLKSDKLLTLSSVEFFTFVKRSLAPDGLAVTWTYNSSNTTSQKHLAIMNNVYHRAGFKFTFPYQAVHHLRGYPVEPFVALSVNGNQKLHKKNSAYLRKFYDKYRIISWKEIYYNPEAGLNTVFAPDYDTIVTPPPRSKGSC